MAGKAERPLWLTTLRGGLVFAATGLVVAVLLYAYATRNTFPGWGVPLWPSAVLMLALPGMEESAARLWTVGVFALNAVWFFLVGVVVTPLVVLVRRRLSARRARA